MNIDGEFDKILYDHESGISAGEYEIVLTYTGRPGYMPSSSTRSFTVVGSFGWIPSFPLESIILGMLLATSIMWIIAK